MKQISVLQSWDDFDQLVGLLKKSYAATVILRVDGPDARRCTLSILNHTVELKHADPWGVTLAALKPAAEPLLEEIANALEQYPAKNPRETKHLLTRRLPSAGRSFCGSVWREAIPRAIRG